MVTAEFSIIPLEGADMRPFVDIAVEAIKRSGLKYEVDALGTAIEGELDEVFSAVKAAHQAVLHAGAARVLTELRIDECRSGDVTIEREVYGYREAEI